MGQTIVRLADALIAVEHLLKLRFRKFKVCDALEAMLEI